MLHSQPKSRVGTTAYIALKVLSRKAYDGKRPLVSLQRITIPEIKNNLWLVKMLTIELMEGEREGGSLHNSDVNDSSQSNEEILYLIQEARKPAERSKFGGHLVGDCMDLDDIDTNVDLEDLETSSDVACLL
ncbi:hypothetical protein HHK36_029413 [Tetracentron sinense]|uniref:Uncharacterized protein n=1 Tax=Tetracentron sinense TaxID=13715 RepID=A0A834YAY2_TETSI|nr:hypothetical protein HHK36_029413 [Tetracentron sinense]